VSVVLLIDDEPGMGALVSSWVSDMGVRVVQALNVRDALAVAESEQPRAILLDLALGEDDGLAVLPELMAAPALAKVPVVAFTVHSSREREARERGVDGFVSKPFRSGDLRAALSGVLG
jgi:CheY-like chemotaxis protein